MDRIPERDWKYLRSILPEMLEELSRRINDEVRGVLALPDVDENTKRGRVYGIVRERDRIVAACFDDWSRSRAIDHCFLLKRHGLLRPEHIENLTEETRRIVLRLPQDVS